MCTFAFLPFETFHICKQSSASDGNQLFTDFHLFAPIKALLAMRREKKEGKITDFGVRALVGNTDTKVSFKKYF